MHAAVVAAADIQADAAVCQEGDKNQFKMRIILVWPGYKPNYRFKSVEDAGIDFFPHPLKGNLLSNNTIAKRKEKVPES